MPYKSATKPIAELKWEALRHDSNYRVQSAMKAGWRAFNERLASQANASRNAMVMGCSRPDGDYGAADNITVTLGNGYVLDLTSALNDALIEAVSMTDGMPAIVIRQSAPQSLWGRMRWLFTGKP